MAGCDRLKVFVGGLSRDTSDVALKEHFLKYGEVADCVVAQDRDSGERRGFGFVTFTDPEAVDRALGDFHVILQRRVDVKRAIPRCEQFRNKHYSNGFSRNGTTSDDHKTSNHSQCSTKKIFVGGLSASVSENEFKSYFEQFGKITDVVVMHDNMTNRPRGFGFITFDSMESVENATRKCFHEIGGKVAEVKRAVPKDEVIANGGHSSRVENGTCSSTNHLNGNYIPYPDAYSSSVPMYGETIGYSYGPPTLFGPVPIGGFYGVSYEVANVGPASPMMFPSPVIGFRGSPMPAFGNVSTYYPTYLNGGVGVLGTPNSVVCNGFANMGVYKGFTEFGNGDGQVAANVPSVQITEIESNGVSPNGGVVW